MSQEYFDKILEIFNSYSKDPEAKSFGLCWSDEQIRESYQKQEVLLEIRNERVVGFIFYRVLDQNIFEIDMTMTDKHFVKMGIMQGLIKKLILKLTQKPQGQNPEGSEIWLEVHKNNVSAINLYEKQGFDIVGRRPRYYPDGGEAVLMNLKI